MSITTLTRKEVQRKPLFELRSNAAPISRHASVSSLAKIALREAEVQIRDAYAVKITDTALADEIIRGVRLMAQISEDAQKGTLIGLIRTWRGYRKAKRVPKRVERARDTYLRLTENAEQAIQAEIASVAKLIEQEVKRYKEAMRKAIKQRYVFELISKKNDDNRIKDAKIIDINRYNENNKYYKNESYNKAAAR